MKGARPKVLQVITSTQRRGAEQFAYGLHPELEARGFAVDTVALSAGEDGLDVAVLGNGMSFRTLRALRSEIKRSDIVLAHGSVTLPACAIASFRTGVPFIYRNIGDPLFWGSNVRRRVQSRVLLSRANAVVALAETTKSRVSEIYRVPNDRITVIPRGVPESVFYPPEPAAVAEARAIFGLKGTDRVALFLGSLTSEKNVLGAIAMMSHLDDWNLLVVGDGPERQEAERAAAAIAPERIHFAGATDDPASAHSCADVLVLPSLTEGLPGVVIEAAMMGIPSVATDVGFIRDIVSEESGRIVKDPSPVELAAAVRVVWQDCHAMGQCARQRVLANYSMRTVADRWAAVINANLPRIR